MDDGREQVDVGTPDQQIEIVLRHARPIEEGVALPVAVTDAFGVQRGAQRAHERDRPMPRRRFGSDHRRRPLSVARALNGVLRLRMVDPVASCGRMVGAGCILVELGTRVPWHFEWMLGCRCRVAAVLPRRTGEPKRAVHL